MSWEILDGDCLERLADLDDDSIDAVVTDPPYGLEFMGKDWDAPWKTGFSGNVEPTSTSAGGASAYSSARVRYHKGQAPALAFQVWTEAWATELLRVLKPGGHLVAFGGTRTYHRLASGIEDAGFEIRDCLAWHYGSGFPKSLDVSKAIDKAAGAQREVVAHADPHDPRTAMARKMYGTDLQDEPGTGVPITKPATDLARQWQGWGTALKPAFEPIILARKPLIGTVAENVTRYGTGALNVDGCRVEGAKGDGVWGTSNATVDPDRKFNASPDGAEYRSEQHPAGRWPANLVLDDQAAAMLDEQSGERPGGNYPKQRGAGVATGFGVGQPTEGGPRSMDDTGGASRFFASFSSGPADMLCVLCGQPYVTTAANLSSRNDHLNGSVDADVQDSQPHGNADTEGPSRSPAEPAASSSPATRETSESSALQSAERRHVEKIVRLAKSAASLCDLCETAIAQNVVRLLLDQTQESDPGPASTIERRRQILSLSLAPVVAGSLSTGIIPTTETLSALCGSAVVATTENTTESGTASAGDPTRFRYVSKASRAERNAGLDGLPERKGGIKNDSGRGYSESDPYREILVRNHHPTVKPIDLMRWLVRLVTPPGGTVLDPFTGSGTTGIAAGLEGFDFVGIEREAEYREIAEARLRWWGEQEGETAEILHRAGLAEKQREKHHAIGQTSLFEVEAA